MIMRRAGYKFWSVATLFIVALLAFSCNETPTHPPGRGLTLSENKTVEFDGTTASLTIVARRDWRLSVTEGREWITPDISRGDAGGYTIVNFTLTKNSTEMPRTGTVTVTANGENEPYLFTITQNSENVLRGVNEWIYERLGKWYYWNDAVKATPPPLNSLEYDAFLQKSIENLPWSSVQDRSNGENPATIDGMWRPDLSDRDHIYSYIERFSAGTRADESIKTTFGFDIEPFYISLTSYRIGFLVIWVQPDGPADKAGIKRGMWIMKYKGAEIYGADYEKFWYQLHYFEGGNSMTLADEEENVYELTATSMKVSPIIHSNVITTEGGKKAAYLVYNEFERGGSVTANGGEFDDELRRVFADFKAQGATELVLDLRYNSGGYVSSCQILTSLAADVGPSDTFIKMLRNKNIIDVYQIANPEILSFRTESNSLRLRKIYVLATRSSASASEMVINALRGVDIEVVHIGEQTNGKNVGMDGLKTVEENGTDRYIDGYRYQMWPITFKILNAKDFTDYANGFTPNLYKNEFWDVTNVAGSGEILELGDPKERLLGAALTLIDGGTVAPDGQSTRATGEAMQPLPAPGAVPGGGAKYIPDMQGLYE